MSGGRDCCCICTYCCCIFPLVGAIKAAVCFIPVTLITIIGWTLCTLILLPYDIYLSYKSIWKSPQLGPNVTVLATLLLPIPLFLWPVIAIILSVLISVVGAIVYPFLETYGLFIEKGNDACGIYKTKVINHAFNGVKDFWNFSYYTRLSILREMMEPGPKFDIKVFHIIMGLLAALFGVAIDGAVIWFLLTIKLLPAMGRLMYNLTMIWLEVPVFSCLCFVPYVLGIFGSIIVCAVGYPILTLCGAMCGVQCAVAVYKNSSVLDGFKQIFINIYWVDKTTNDAIFGKRNLMCCACCNLTLSNGEQAMDQNHNVREEPHNVPAVSAVPAVPAVDVVVHDTYNGVALAQAPGAPQARRDEQKVSDNDVDIVRIWNNFFDMCTIQGIYAKQKGFITQAEVESSDPDLFIVIPGLVIVRALLRSVAHNGIELSDGLVVDERNRPHDPISDYVYPTLISIKQDLVSITLTPNEVDFVEKWLATNGNNERCAQDTAAISNERLVQLKRFTSKIQSVATNVTRMPTFHRFFFGSLEAIRNHNG